MPLDDAEVVRTAAKPLRWDKLLIGADHMRVFTPIDAGHKTNALEARLSV